MHFPNTHTLFKTHQTVPLKVNTKHTGPLDCHCSKKHTAREVESERSLGKWVFLSVSILFIYILSLLVIVKCLSVGLFIYFQQGHAALRRREQQQALQKEWSDLKVETGGMYSSWERRSVRCQEKEKIREINNKFNQTLKHKNAVIQE